jgi:hypothetical protein
MTYPILEKIIKKKNNLSFQHDCGDLWFREDVSFQDDFDKAYDKDVDPVIKESNNIESLTWKMRYTAPYEDQIKGKIIKKYKIAKDNNIHYATILSYKENVLFLCTEFIFFSPEYVVNLIKKFHKVKKVQIWGQHLSEGFLEVDDDDEYIIKTLKNPRWITFFVDKDDKETNKDIKIIKRLSDSKIEFDFLE